MTSSNGNIFRATAPLWGEFTGEFPSQRPVTRSFDDFFDVHLNDVWVNNRDAGDLRCHRAHYDVTVIRNLNETRGHQEETRCPNHRFLCIALGAVCSYLYI